jgi:hypothetical protein
MAENPLQHYYFDLLLDRVRSERYPSHQMLDHIESSFWTGDQISEYVAALLEKLEGERYPSHQMLRRIERMMLLTSTVT